MGTIEIADSARKHGVLDDDMLHAVHNPWRWIDQEEGRVLIIGPDRAGNWLEVVVLDPDGDPAIIHANKARGKFLNVFTRKR